MRCWHLSVRSRLFLIYCFFAVLVSGRLAAQEQIVSFHSDLVVGTDASLTVLETIRVRAEGTAIQHGIVRRLPLQSWSASGARRDLTVNVDSVARDNAPETFRTRSLWRRATQGGPSLQVWIGRSGVQLSRGVHEYRIAYTVRNAIRLGPGQDELSWSITGERWPFDILEVSSNLRLPPGIDTKAVSCAVYRNYRKATDETVAVSSSGTNRIVIQSTLPLRPWEALALQVRWPTGHLRRLHQPIPWTRPGDEWILGCLAGLVIYALGTRLALGRQKAVDLVQARPEPPPNLSPASCRYVWQLDYDDKCLAAALVNLAIKGFIQIHELAPGRFQLRNLFPNGQRGLSLSEGLLYGALLGNGSVLSLENFNGVAIQEAKRRFQEALRQECDHVYVQPNRRWAILPVALAVTAGGAVALCSTDPAGAFLVLGLSSALVLALRRPFRGASEASRSRRWVWPRLFVGGVLVVLFLLTTFWARGGQPLISPSGFVGVLALAVCARECFQWVRRWTPSGSALRDEIAGFRVFLMKKACRRQARSAESSAPVVSAALVPFAVALDVELPYPTASSSTVPRVQENSGPWFSSRTQETPLMENVAKWSAGLALAVAASATTPPHRSDEPGNTGGGDSLDGSGGGGGDGGGGW